MATAFKIALLFLFFIFLVNNAKADKLSNEEGIFNNINFPHGSHHNFVVHELKDANQREG